MATDKLLMVVLSAIIIGISILVVLLFSITCSSKTITVDDDGGADYTKIQDAIDNATKGNVIRLFSGIYSEDIVIDKQIALIGNGSNECLINGDGVNNPFDNIIEVTSDSVNITGISCRNGYYGIQVRSDNVTIFGINCLEADKYGIYLNGSRNSVIDANYIFDSGIGIFLQSSTNITVRGNICQRNVAGIRAFSSHNSTFTSNVCEENRKAGIDLGAISNNNSIIGNRIQANDDGILLTWITNISIQDNSLIDNQDGINIRESAWISIEGNQIDGNSRFGLSVARSNNILIENEEVINSNENGLSICECTNITITKSAIKENAIGIYIWDSSREITVENCTILGNSEWGMNATSNDGIEIIAISNWWGNQSGPYHHNTNSEGKGDNVTDDIVFNPWLEQPLDYFPPTAEIVSSYPLFIMKGELIVFEASVLVYGFVDYYIWASDIDGEFYNGTEESFTYSMLSNGTHNISLMIVDNFGVLSEIVETTVTVNGKPICHINSIIPNPVTVSHSILFSGYGTDDGIIKRYVWKTNDTELHNDTTSDFSTSEFERGTHWIFFKVQDDYGVWSDEVVQTVIVHEQPVASITSITPNPALNNESVFINGTGTDDEFIQRYVWRTDTEELHNDTFSWFSHSVLSHGSHTVYFRVQDNYGVWSNETNETLIIHERPHASIDSIKPSPGFENQLIRFAGTGTDDGSILRYVWRTEDGEFHNGTEAEFQYAGLPVATHTVYFRVQDNYGIWSDEVSTSVIIHTQPVATIESIFPNPAIESVAVTFCANGTDDGEIVRYIWLEGVNELYNGTEAEFSISDLSPRDYTINLLVQDNHEAWSEAVSQEMWILADTDADGIADEDDAFPEDPSASKDSDGDGYPDEWNVGKTEKDTTTGLKLDEYPEDSKKWEKDKGGSSGFIPGFKLVILVISLAIVLMKRRRE